MLCGGELLQAIYGFMLCGGELLQALYVCMEGGCLVISLTISTRAYELGRNAD